MGLLEKSTNLREEETPVVSGEPLAGEEQAGGLLARASTFHDSEPHHVFPAPEGAGIELQPQASGVGLLARAEEQRGAVASDPEEQEIPAGPQFDEPHAGSDPLSAEFDDELMSDAELEDQLGGPLDDEESGGAVDDEIDEAAEAYDELMGPADRGLLARAEALHDDPDEKPGLLARAEELYDQPEAAHGLLARAEELHDEPEEPHGLLARAEELHDEPEEPHGLLARAEELHDLPEEAHGLLARAEAVQGEPIGESPSAEPAAETDYADFAEVDQGEVLGDDLLPDLDFSEDDDADIADPGATPATLAGESDADAPGGLLARAEQLHDAEETPAPVMGDEAAPAEDIDTFARVDEGEVLDDELLPDLDFSGDEEPVTQEVAEVEASVEEDPEAAIDLDRHEHLDELEVETVEPAGAADAEGDDTEGDEPVLLEAGDAFDEPEAEAGTPAEESGTTASPDDEDEAVDLDREPSLFDDDMLDESASARDATDVRESAAIEPAGADGEPLADTDLDLPGWEYDGPDSPDDDPFLLDNAGETEEKLFEDWEDEAEFEAERGIKELEGRPVAQEARRDLILEADSEFTTVPDEVHIASQKKIDNYLSLFDITKEISTIDDFDNLWDAVLYAVMGQVGAETICIFSTTSRNGESVFEPVAHSGFTMPDGWSLRPGDRIYDTLLGQPEIKYAQEFLGGSLAGQERVILETTAANLVVPLKNQERTYGILLLGGQISGDEYSLDDLEFLNLLGEISAVGVDRVLSRLEYEQDTSDLKRRTVIHKKIFELSRQSSNARTIDEIYDTLADHLIEDFNVESFSVVLLSPRDQEYRIFAGNQISPASLEKFNLGVSSDLVGMISNLTHVYELTDFRENQEITRNYTNDDLALMQTYWIVPLINLNWLVGFMTIHRTSRSWSDFQREMLVTLAEIMAPVFANSIILGERETLFRDPFSPLESRLRTELKKAAEFQAPVSLVEIRVKNIKRLLALNPADQVSEFLTVLGRSIAGFLFETDFIARIGQGRFALILPGRGGEEAEIIVKKLRSEFKRVGMLPGSPIDVQYSHQIITAPHDTDDPEKILSMLD